jgi:hypothetical protein
MTPADLHFARKIDRLWRSGARPFFELLCELGAERLVRQPIEAKVDHYLARLDRDRLAVTGRDQIPTAPLYLIHSRTE